MEVRSERIVLGIDPGLAHTGWSVVSMSGSIVKYVASGVLHSKQGDELSVRLSYLHSEVIGIIEQYKPIACAIEKTYVNINSASSLKLAHARGAILAAVGASLIEVMEYEAKTVKKTIVGNGNADKLQVARMLKLLMPELELETKAGDQSDAIAIALCGLYQYKANATLR
jgi:crossover junction endodeoxyribonuclease RuvC